MFLKKYYLLELVSKTIEESVKEIYTDQNKDFKFQIMGTHPHQIHFEIFQRQVYLDILSF